MQIMKRTKIIATLGPATDDINVLKKLIQAGTDLVRVNFSHGTTEVANRIKMVRDIGRELQCEIGILADLQGPKIRIARFKDGKVTLQAGHRFLLDADLADDGGDEHQVGIDYKELVHDVVPGDRLMLDDGRIELLVVAIQKNIIECTVTAGGILSNRKGINKFNGGLSADAITEKDKADIKTAVELGCDYLAISFVRTADDIQIAKQLLTDAGGSLGIIAKIERREAVDHLDAIIAASDAVMVARGDLGVEIGDAHVPRVQKLIIHRARTLNKAVITATQMMESMIDSPIPTRAEVSDVANAVIDGTDAIMLSAETAVGKYPIKAVESMVRVCVEAEKNPLTVISRHRVECTFTRVDETIAMAAMYTANHLNIRAIISLTESGMTPLWMSRIRSGIPIFGLSRNIATQRRMTLFRGVYPVPFDVTKIELSRINRAATEALSSLGQLNLGDLVIITRGECIGTLGGTDTMKIVKMGEQM